MANMKAVNKAVKTAFPNMDIEVVRGNGYVYFHGTDGWEKILPLYGCNPPTTSTEDMIRTVVDHIEYDNNRDKSGDL